MHPSSIGPLIMLLTEIAGWYSQHIDYIPAFSQAPIDTTVCGAPAEQYGICNAECHQCYG